ncbi:hypothetical protein BPAE_0078g00510 [Botrytis paeoniae]|uniref:Uncharacterized protein n=1 Tax=Botrytis paeoniae TaxID=278948 RepID=A0A4Z1FRN9_9HELO|nr:hypothetical protein BPAE_0078g00510 [Botrytis paeoniae]
MSGREIGRVQHSTTSRGVYTIESWCKESDGGCACKKRDMEPWSQRKCEPIMDGNGAKRVVTASMAGRAFSNSDTSGSSPAGLLSGNLR